MLDPPRGVAPLRIGMTLDEALAAVAGWAESKVFRGEDSDTPLRFNAVLVAAEDYYDFLDSRDAD